MLRRRESGRVDERLVYSKVRIKSSPSNFMPEEILSVLTTPARGLWTIISIFMATEKKFKIMENPFLKKSWGLRKFPKFT